MTEILKKRAILFYGGFASRSGGAFMHTTTLSEGLRNRGWSVDTITLDCLPWVFRYLPHIVTIIGNWIYPPLGFYYKGLLTRELYKLFIERDKSDLLVFEDIYLGWNSDNPSISVLHAVWSDNLQSYDFDSVKISRLKAKEVKLINRLDHHVITVSDPYKRFLEDIHFRGFENIDLDVVELGVNTDGFTPRGHKDDFDHNRSLIYCGALEARKNIYFMLDVFSRIAAVDPLATLTIVGDGPDRDGLEKYAAQCKISVDFLGRLPHEKVLLELVKHDIYIHTASKESFSFALLEAKLSGLTTCALSSLEVPQEFIDVGLENFDVEEWSAKILAIDARPDLKDFPDYSIDRLTEHTLSLVSM